MTDIGEPGGPLTMDRTPDGPGPLGAAAGSPLGRGLRRLWAGLRIFVARVLAEPVRDGRLRNDGWPPGLAAIAGLGHQGGTADHTLATSAMFLHIPFAAVWPGGLAALAWLRSALDGERPRIVLERHPTCLS